MWDRRGERKGTVFDEEGECGKREGKGGRVSIRGVSVGMAGRGRRGLPIRGAEYGMGGERRSGRFSIREASVERAGEGNGGWFSLRGASVGTEEAVFDQGGRVWEGQRERKGAAFDQFQPLRASPRTQSRWERPKSPFPSRERANDK